MPRIDAHQHFWHYDPVRDSWITEEMQVIRRDFLPSDLQLVLERNGFDGCVLVQASEDNDFLLEIAAQHEFVRGVVGWVDFLEERVGEKLAFYSQFEKMKGFRYILQSAEDRALMLQPAFRRGIRKLQPYGYTYDLLIYPDQLAYTRELIEAFPDQPFVLDHLAKPNIKQGQFKEWQKEIKAFAEHENVSCKISGLVTEADWHGWQKSDFRPYLDTVVETFGVERLMYGSDWPVCLVAGAYEEVLGLVEEYFAGFSQTEQALIFGDNAARFYRLSS
ncbi:amidohydrolase family protein [Rufibacter hautae]|uniref:Amidohydrolase family protein n=1 Tax=Rufibacter hautae TaxID=2595005 RepID=A0A5B6TIK6_9BACT|nr:amidohydrolase family protein [Rufibacter hautae]KAA3439205.1 amidohydrolase family protein [Rufibacter hautae]